MAAMSPGTALRNLQQAHAGLKKVRHLLRLARESEGSVDSARVIRAGWEGLAKAHKILAETPVEAADDAVMTKQLAVQRYSTAILVRLRRISRNDPAAFDEGDDAEDSD